MNVYCVWTAGVNIPKIPKIFRGNVLKI